MRSTTGRSVISTLLLTALTLTGCGPELPPEDEGDGLEATTEQAVIAEGSPDAVALLDVANTLTQSQLVQPAPAGAGISSTAAAGIVAFRNGADRLAGTADDQKLKTIAELDAIYGVGVATINRLLAYAKAHPRAASQAFPFKAGDSYVAQGRGFEGVHTGFYSADNQCHLGGGTYPKDCKMRFWLTPSADDSTVTLQMIAGDYLGNWWGSSRTPAATITLQRNADGSYGSAGTTSVGLSGGYLTGKTLRLALYGSDGNAGCGWGRKVEWSCAATYSAP